MGGSPYQCHLKKEGVGLSSAGQRRYHHCDDDNHRRYPRRLMLTLAVPLFVANTVNIEADLAAVAAAIAWSNPVIQLLSQVTETTLRA